MWRAFYLSIVEHSSNNHLSETTWVSPFLANYRRFLCMSFEFPLNNIAANPTSPKKFAKDMRNLHEYLLVETRYAQDMHEQNISASCTLTPNFQVGTLYDCPPILRRRYFKLVF